MNRTVHVFTHLYSQVSIKRIEGALTTRLGNSKIKVCSYTNPIGFRFFLNAFWKTRREKVFFDLIFLICFFAATDACQVTRRLAHRFPDGKALLFLVRKEVQSWIVALRSDLTTLSGINFLTVLKNAPQVSTQKPVIGASNQENGYTNRGGECTVNTLT